jgi:hypothetical protein
VDRVLRGEKPANLSVQLQAKFEMVIDGGTIRPSALAGLLRANEQIELALTRPERWHGR